MSTRPAAVPAAAISSANRDPAQFPDPDRLDLGRDTSGHVAFGHGVHHCLGAPLARMEAEVALGALLAHFARISLAVPPSELRWRPVSLMNGLESLPVRLNRSGWCMFSWGLTPGTGAVLALSAVDVTGGSFSTAGMF